MTQHRPRIVISSRHPLKCYHPEVCNPISYVNPLQHRRWAETEKTAESELVATSRFSHALKGSTRSLPHPFSISRTRSLACNRTTGLKVWEFVSCMYLCPKNGRIRARIAIGYSLRFNISNLLHATACNPNNFELVNTLQNRYLKTPSINVPSLIVTIIQ